jgi:hypothetical protein
MVRRMRDHAYRAEQWRNRYAPHVEPINRLVDELGELRPGARPPYVAPMYRGVHAPMVAILRDPGPKAGGAAGSGFLSVGNDDQTAERQCTSGPGRAGPPGGAHPDDAAAGGRARAHHRAAGGG